MNFEKMEPEKLTWPSGTKLMRFGARLKKFAAILLLVPSLILLSACSGIRVKVATDCAWAEEIRFSEATKTWLENQEWPNSALEDFNQIAVHNELFTKFCLGEE